MKQFLNLSGHVAAFLGIVLCLVSGVARMAGSYHTLGFENMTLFMAGTGLMVAACLAKLEKLSMAKP